MRVHAFPCDLLWPESASYMSTLGSKCLMHGSLGPVSNSLWDTFPKCPWLCMVYTLKPVGHCSIAWATVVFEPFGMRILVYGAETPT